MNKKQNSLGKPEPFSWSAVSKKINKEAKNKGDIHAWVERTHKRRSSSSSSEDEFDTRVSSRQKELLRSSPRISEKSPLVGRIRNFQDGFTERSWLRSARQSELVLNGSDSSIPKLPRDQPKSALQKQWPSTAKRRETPEIIKGDWIGSAGSRESHRDSAGSIRTSEKKGNFLVEAIRFGRTRHIKLLLDGGADPNTPDDEGKALVKFIQFYGHCIIAKSLFFSLRILPSFL